MSADGIYLLHYESQPYASPTPWDVDSTFLLAAHAGEFVKVTSCDYIWEKPKHQLLLEEVAKLLADQVLESVDGNNWRDVTVRKDAGLFRTPFSGPPK